MMRYQRTLNSGRMQTPSDRVYHRDPALERAQVLESLLKGDRQSDNLFAEGDGRTGLHYVRDHTGAANRPASSGGRQAQSSPTGGGILNAMPLGLVQGAAETAPWLRRPPLSRGNRGVLTDREIANIIFNELRSFQGEGVDIAREDMAHAIMNGDEALGRKRHASASTEARVPPVERPVYEASVRAVQIARTQRALGMDPTNGAMHFNQRPNNSTSPFYGEYRVRTQRGPFGNSFPTKQLPESGVYANTYD